MKLTCFDHFFPQGCSFGYHAGGWGKPPVDEVGKPLYGDVFGTSSGEAPVRLVALCVFILHEMTTELGGL